MGLSVEFAHVLISSYFCIFATGLVTLSSNGWMHTHQASGY